jgi:hypothetical protein
LEGVIMAKLIGKSFVNDNKGILDQTGDWVVTVLFTETEYYDDETTKEEKIVVKAMDSDFQNAHETALGSALRQLRAEVYDRGFRSLIEAREASDAPSKVNTPTITQ